MCRERGKKIPVSLLNISTHTTYMFYIKKNMATQLNKTNKETNKALMG